jgi:spoIIIJ-associated protein
MTLTDFTQRLLAHMGIDNATVTIEEGEPSVLQISVSEEDSGLLIGYHGETLGSLQKVLQLIYREEYDEKRLVVNINDYKQRREQQLKEIVEKVAQRVLETGNPYIFSFLPANERLIIHQVVSQTPEFSELESVSSGEGHNRRLEIRQKTQAA